MQAITPVWLQSGSSSCSSCSRAALPTRRRRRSRRAEAQRLCRGPPEHRLRLRLWLPQVLSLGAGYDTTFFQLAASGVTAARYAELDFSEVRAWTQAERVVPGSLPKR